MITSTIKVKNSSGAWEVIKDKTATDYSDNNLKTAKAYTDTAKSAAISTAAADATTKANSAKSAAVSAAATDATTKANAAQSNAISSAATAASKIYVKGASSDGAMLTFTRGDGTTFSSLVVGDNAAAHNSVYRGKDITAAFNNGTMSTNIANGTFHDIFVGDYITKSITVNGTTYSNIKWEVADLDYFLHTGDGETAAHHVVLFPNKTIQVNVNMNDKDTTEGGFLGSKMWKTTIPLYVTGIVSAFGDAHVLSHREFLSNAVTSTASSSAGAGWTGSSSGWEWTDVRVNIPSEPMIYGGQVFGSSGFDVGNKNRQLSIFHFKHFSDGRLWFWLQAVASSSAFAIASDNGNASYSGAERSDSNGGLRPYFLLR